MCFTHNVTMKLIFESLDIKYHHFIILADQILNFQIVDCHHPHPPRFISDFLLLSYLLSIACLLQLLLSVSIATFISLCLVLNFLTHFFVVLVLIHPFFILSPLTAHIILNFTVPSMLLGTCVAQVFIGLYLAGGCLGSSAVALNYFCFYVEALCKSLS